MVIILLALFIFSYFFGHREKIVSALEAQYFETLQKFSLGEATEQEVMQLNESLNKARGTDIKKGKEAARKDISAMSKKSS